MFWAGSLGMIMTILDTIIAHKRTEAAALRSRAAK